MQPLLGAIDEIFYTWVAISQSELLYVYMENMCIAH